MSDFVRRIDAAARSTTEVSEAVSTTARTLAAHAITLKRVIGFFRTADQAVAGPGLCRAPARDERCPASDPPAAAGLPAAA